MAPTVIIVKEIVLTVKQLKYLRLRKYNGYSCSTFPSVTRCENSNFFQPRYKKNGTLLPVQARNAGTRHTF